MRLQHHRTALKLGLAVALALIFGVSPASADMIDISLSTPNWDPSSPSSPYVGPYGDVNVNLTDSTHATITLTAAASPGGTYQYRFGDGGTLGLNTNGTVTAGPITGNGGSYSLGGAGNEDGFGQFNFTINTFDGFGHSSTNLTFVLTNTSGSWSSASDVLTANDNGHEAAGHVFVANANGTNTGFTGFATDTFGATPTPPSAVLLGIGVALCCFVTWLRRRSLGMAA